MALKVGPDSGVRGPDTNAPVAQRQSNCLSNQKVGSSILLGRSKDTT